MHLAPAQQTARKPVRASEARTSSVVAARSVMASDWELQVVGCLPPVAGEPADVPDDVRVRLAGQNPHYCKVDLRPVAAAGWLCLIAAHIDKLVPWLRAIRAILARWILSA